MPKRRLKRTVLLLVLQLHAAPCFAEDRTRYLEVVPRSHETIETLRYLGYIYVLTLGIYLAISHNEVFNNATLQNYVRNFGNLSMFDQDAPGANWGMHVATGALAYEFYRARSYTKTDAFFLTLAQECLFQFTVETMIQPTGLENVVNTGIVGTVVGRGLEVASLPLLNSDFGLFRGVGYLFNLPALLGLYESTTKITPMVEKGAVGVQIQMHF